MWTIAPISTRRLFSLLHVDFRSRICVVTQLHMIAFLQKIVAKYKRHKIDHLNHFKIYS